MFCQEVRRNEKPVGLFGGTFDPIHLGHVEIARQACREFGLEKVIVMPSGNPPHKKGRHVTPDRMRCDMVKLAIEKYPELEFSDHEILKEGYSYSSETLTELSQLYERIYFIIGADSLLQIENWHCPETVMRLAVLAVADRDRKTGGSLEECARCLERKYNARIVFLHTRDIPISSSDIRERIRNSEPVSGMLDPKVEDYIYRNGLYEYKI